MTTAASDATIEDLEQLVTIEEAGLRLARPHRRQTYISGIPGEPWQECWRIEAAELRAGLPELPETFDTKAEALAAAVKLIREQFTAHFGQAPQSLLNQKEGYSGHS